MSTLSRLTLASSIAALMLTGCADHRATKATTPSTTTTSSRTSLTTNTDTMKHRERAATSTTSPTAITSSPPDNTGIAACDDYLSSYLACHRAARIYAPDQLQSRYEAMRTSLLRDSQNPDIRPQLGARCNSLASQLHQALHGKSCASAPAEGGSTP